MSRHSLTPPRRHIFEANRASRAALVADLAEHNAACPPVCQFNQDQILVLSYSEDPRGRVTGISVLDRTNVDILDLVNERDSIQKAHAADTAALRRELTNWATRPRNGEPMAAQRMFVGRDRSKSALMSLSDPQGKVRLRLAVDSLGAARIEFLDADGKVTRAIP